MRGLLILLLVLNLTACANKDSGSSAGSGSATEQPIAQPGSAAAAGSANAAGSAEAGSAAAPVEAGSATAGSNDGADEVAQIVVRDVGSNALGNQKIEASCVSVIIMPGGDWTVAAARLKDCGDKTARSILWVFKRKGNGKWNEDYLGQPPRCWKGVPPDIAEAVSKATKIPSC